MRVTLETIGIREALAAMDRVQRLEAQRELKDEFNRVALDVVNTGRSKAGSRLEHAAARTLRTASTATYGAVGFGGGFGGAFGAEFGGMRGQHRVVNHFGHYTGWNQFQPWRGSDSGAGYFLWPAIREVTAEHLDDLGEAVEKIFTKG